jgi:hypothetical protein
VPVNGLVRLSTHDGAGREISRTELLAWGNAGGAERPLFLSGSEL